nr:hypothetical protein [Pseudarcicella sp.]
MTENKKLLQLTLSFPFGDHSNRLFQNLHFEAFCKEHSVNYVNPSFENLQSFYVNPCAITSKKKSFLSKHPKLLLKLNKLNLLSNVILFDEESPANENILLETSNENTFVGGWGFRTHSLTEKYQDDFSERYTLKANFYENNELFKIFSQKRNEGFI